MADTIVAYQDEEGVTIVTIDCEAVRERQAAILRVRLAELADRNAGLIAISFKQVKGVSSAIISDLLDLSILCRKKGGRLTVFDLGPTMRELFKSTGMDRALTIAKCREDVLRSYAPHRFPEARLGVLKRLIGRAA
ncbi:MAG: STAS domain-containing protein [Phycisphaerales bacterium]|nr:STAS domain-containing protein [Phycisphaerales bacterium]